jgi:hypothetical protein
LQAQDKETARKSLEHRMAELEQQYSVKKTELDRVTKECENAKSRIAEYQKKKKKKMAANFK